MSAARPVLGIIGGTGLSHLPGLQATRSETVQTIWGPPSAALLHGNYANRDVVFLARHGVDHTIPPHRINYRANIQALNDAGVTHIIGFGAVGAIRAGLQPGDVLIPDQIIDYTWSREQTFHDDFDNEVAHIDFTEPYCEVLRAVLIQAAGATLERYFTDGVYAATQGPRLETAAEIDRLERDGCDVVGMTGMPEAALARELGLCYAACTFVANLAAGRGDTPLTMTAINDTIRSGSVAVASLLAAAITLIK